MSINAEEMKRMIQDEIKSIRSLEERVIFKELMEGVFLSLYETNEQMYQDLENRVMNELEVNVNRYLIKTGIIERQYLDNSHHLMFPMDEADLKEKTFHLSEILDAIAKDEGFRLMKVMIQCDYLELQELWNNHVQFKGVLDTGKESEITVELRPCLDYLDYINNLYQLFIKNNIPWQTINAPYLYKMAEVVIVDVSQAVRGNEKIKNFRIDFDKYSSNIHFDLVPIWNIKKFRLDTVGFPIPCEEHKNFEHEVLIKDYGKEHAYLIGEDQDIQSITQKEHKLYIISETDGPQKWDIYIIKNGENKKIDRYSYSIMQNFRTEHFMEKFQRKWNQTVKTKAELFRFIKGFGLETYLEYCDCKVSDRFDGEIETYNMNSFIIDEIRENKSSKKLILYFKGISREQWLVRDIASFIVSEIQRIYPEYECGGKFL
jgi:hypothetical protein